MIQQLLHIFILRQWRKWDFVHNIFEQTLIDTERQFQTRE